MNTKEQILEKLWLKYDMAEQMTDIMAMEAMDEYAKQEAIAFLKDVFSEIDINGCLLSSVCAIDAEELYKIYLDSK